MDSTPIGEKVKEPAEAFALPGPFELESESDITERAIPIRPADLIRSLLAEAKLSPRDHHGFAEFAKLLGSVFHYEYFGWLNELKDLYSPLDPDSDCATLKHASKTRTKSADEHFLRPFEAALLRANYRPLSFEALEKAVAAPNELGLTYTPDFKIFEHLKVYVRGRTEIRRVFRTIRTKYRKREVILPGYSRVVVILKFREKAKLDQYARSDVLYLRLFKDVPHVDMEMHLPEQGTKVRMRMVDKVQIGSPFLTGIPVMIGKFLAVSLISRTAALTMIAAPFTAGVNSFFGFQRAKQKHLAHMIRNLYYLTLANNASVINRLIDSAEEEEFKEALLGYYFLWTHQDDPEPWDQQRLDEAIEQYITRETGLLIDFEISDAVRKLLRLGIVQSDGHGKLQAVPIEQALQILDQRWDQFFRYHNDAVAGADRSARRLANSRLLR